MEGGTSETSMPKPKEVCKSANNAVGPLSSNSNKKKLRPAIQKWDAANGQKNNAAATKEKEGKATKSTLASGTEITSSTAPMNPLFDSPIEIDKGIIMTQQSSPQKMDERVVEDGGVELIPKPNNNTSYIIISPSSDLNDLNNNVVSPINPFDAPTSSSSSLEGKIASENNVNVGPNHDIEGGRGGSGKIIIENDDNEAVLSKSKRRLDDVFANESDRDYSQHADTEEELLDGNMQQHQQQQQQQHPDLDLHNREAAITRNIEEGAPKEGGKENEKNRNTVSTKRISSLLWDENLSQYSNKGDESISSSSNNNNNNDADDDDDDEQSYSYNRCSNCFLRIIHRICHPHIHPPCISNLTHPHTPKFLEKISPRARRIACRSLIIIFMCITISFVCLDLLILHQYLHVWLNSTLAWLSANPVSGGVAFIGIFLFASLCFFPIAMLSLGAGYVYIELYGLGLGILVAFIVCYSGCLLGAAVCFARSRYLMRQLVERFSVKYPIVRAVDRSFETMGLRLFLLLRLSPAMPFNALNYIGGITAIKFHDYWWATVLGVVPGLLWTIFIGATFGTVDARGVDGKEEFDENSLRKGLVLGLGISLGVMGLVGTGIYARRELTKIIIQEQIERALEEQQAGAEISQRLTDDECEATTEEGDAHSLKFEDIEKQQHLGESIGDFSFGHDEVMSSDNLDSISPAEKRQRTKQRPWTPETVAAQLPILPKMLSRSFTPITFESMEPDQLTTDCEENNDASLSVTPADGSSRKNSKRSNHHLSASMPPLAGVDNLSFFLDDNDDKGRNTVDADTSPDSSTRSRRHSLQHNSPDNAHIEVALIPPGRPRASSAPFDDDIIIGLANIDEMDVLSDDDMPKGANQAAKILSTPIVNRGQINCRRCNTDPTHRGKHGSASSVGDDEEKGRTTPQRKRRQQSPFWTPTKEGLRKRFHSFGSFGAWQTPPLLPQQPPLSGLAAMSRTLPSPQRQAGQSQQNRERSSSLPLQFSPSGNHLELTFGNDGSDEDDDAPSREWFWIWA